MSNDNRNHLKCCDVLNISRSYLLTVLYVIAYWDVCISYIFLERMAWEIGWPSVTLYHTTNYRVRAYRTDVTLCTSCILMHVFLCIVKSVCTYDYYHQLMIGHCGVRP